MRHQRNNITQAADTEGAWQVVGLVEPYEDALVFKVPAEEREILIEAEPGTFFVTPHYQGHPMVLVRPDKLDLANRRAQDRTPSAGPCG